MIKKWPGKWPGKWIEKWLDKKLEEKFPEFMEELEAIGAEIVAEVSFFLSVTYWTGLILGVVFVGCFVKWAFWGRLRPARPVSG
jgi:hypothetical protein